MPKLLGSKINLHKLTTVENYIFCCIIQLTIHYGYINLTFYFEISEPLN